MEISKSRLYKKGDFPFENVDKYSTTDDDDDDDDDDDVGADDDDDYEVNAQIPRKQSNSNTIGIRNKVNVNSYNRVPISSPAKCPSTSSDSIGNYKPAACVLLFAAIYVLMIVNKVRNESTVKDCKLKELQNSYKNLTADVWTTITNGVEKVFDNAAESPYIYLFTHSDGKYIDKFVENILNYLSCLERKPSVVHLNVEHFSSTEAIDDYGHIIRNYKEEAKEGNLVLIVCLNYISPKAARALHAICDVYNPIIKNVAIFLKLILPDNQDNNASIVETTLTNLWGVHLQEFELDALITRVTDQIIHL